jgi:hypothetical protein
VFIYYGHSLILSSLAGQRSRPRKSPKSIRVTSLFANSQSLDNRAVPLYILRFEVVEQMPPLSHEFQQAPAGMMVLEMGPEMLRQIIDPFAQDRDLHFRRSCVRGMPFVFLNEFLFLFWQQCHVILLSRVLGILGNPLTMEDPQDAQDLGVPHETWVSIHLGFSDGQELIRTM